MSPQILIAASSSSKLSCWTKSLWKKHNEAWSRSRKAGPVYLPSKKKNGDREWKENEKKYEKKILKEFQNKNKRKNEKKIKKN